ncbi:MAG TPA: lysozyme inhibitor LprI family protein [Pseudoxanthomonas sp.]|nr:lysozyme inhibitor LprI family protein [Pseudoxanthomonas sp.]
MKTLARLLAIGCIASSLPVMAQDGEAPSPGVDASYRRCIDDTRTTPEVRACGDALLQRLDARLNEQWRLAAGYLDGAPRQRLLEEQRAWIRYKDMACRFYLDEGFGSQGASGDFPLCLARVIQHRIDELEGIQRSMDAGSAS